MMSFLLLGRLGSLFLLAFSFFFPQKALAESFQQGCNQYRVFGEAHGESVGNDITITVTGSSGTVIIAQHPWNDGDSEYWNTVITSCTPPGFGIGIGHETGHRWSAADCLADYGVTVPGGHQNAGCREDWMDNDFNDLTYGWSIVLIDTTPPVTTHALAGTTGNNGYYTSNVVVTLTATDSGGGTVSSTTLDGSAYTAPRTIATEGTTTHTYFSTDNSSNTESTKNFTLKIDKTAPTSAFTSHSSGAILYSTVTLGGTTTDATSGVAGMQFSTDSGLTWNNATLQGGNLWSYVLNTTTLSDGNRTLQVRATDNAGHVQSPVTSLNIFISNAPPSASLDLSCPLPGDDGWCRAPVNVALSGSSIGAPVTSVTYSIDGGSETTVGTNRTSFGLTGSTHTAKGYVTNSVGKKSSTQSGSAKVDGAPPEVEFRGATRMGLFFRLADNESGLKRWTLQIFDASGLSRFYHEGAGDFNGELAWDASSFVGNDFSVDIFARDAAGNENAVKRAKFTLNQIATPIPTPTATSVRAAVVVRQPTATATLTLTPTIPAIAQLPAANAQPLAAANNQPPTPMRIQVPLADVVNTPAAETESFPWLEAGLLLAGGVAASAAGGALLGRYVNESQEDSRVSDDAESMLATNVSYTNTSETVDPFPANEFEENVSRTSAASSEEEIEVEETIIEKVPHYVEQVVQEGWDYVTERIPRYITQVVQDGYDTYVRPVPEWVSKTFWEPVTTLTMSHSQNKPRLLEILTLE